MTVASVARRKAYTVGSSGQQGPYAFTFTVLDQDDLAVYVGSTSSSTRKTITTHYTVTLATDGTGSITFVSGQYPTEGQLVTIIGDRANSRTTNFTAGGDIRASTLNDDLDSLTVQVQQLDEAMDRAIQVPVFGNRNYSSLGPLQWPYDTTSNNANKLVAYNSAGTALELVDQITNLDFSTDNFAVASDQEVTIKAGGVAAAELGSDIITGQTALTSGLASTDELIVSDAGTTKRMDVSVLTDYYKDLSVTETNKTLTSPVINSGVSGTGVKDEDDMSSDSATHLATQQSIKAYVDSQTSTMSFYLEDDDGTEVNVTQNKEVKLIGSGVTTNWTDTDNGTDGDPYDLTITVDAAQTGITSLLATDIKIGEDDQTKIDFEDADTINFYAGNEKQLILTDGALTPGADNILDLGSSSVQFKDGYFHGTLEADAITVGGTSTATLYSPLAGSSSITSTGTISSGTWQGTAIASAYIAADAITAAKIADDAISEEHLDNTAITGFSALTSVADDDLLLISDTNDSANLKKITKANLVSGLATGNNLATSEFTSTGKSLVFGF